MIVEPIGPYTAALADLGDQNTHTQDGPYREAVDTSANPELVASTGSCCAHTSEKQQYCLLKSAAEGFRDECDGILPRRTGQNARFAVHSWLQDYAFRVEISWWIFLAAGLIAVLIAQVTISFRAIQAAMKNPVSSLRSE